MQNTREYRDSIRRAVKPVVEFLDSINVRHAVVGSTAAFSHGYGRTTSDVDIVVELDPPLSLSAKVAEEFVKRFDGPYYVEAGSIRDAIRHKSSFNLYHFATGIKLDFFVSKGRQFDVNVIERRQLETMDDDVEPAFYVQSAEDLVLSKLAWYRQGNSASDRQWNDILAILKIQVLIADTEYLRNWAPSLGVEDLLEKAFEEAGYQELN